LLVTPHTVHLWKYTHASVGISCLSWAEVSVHPIVFHHVLDEATVEGWQVIQEPSGLRVLLAGLARGASAEGVRDAVSGSLTAAGVTQTQVEVRVVEHVERTALGKTPLVRRLPAPG
jgi:phenylacetate-CoA ligase